MNNIYKIYIINLDKRPDRWDQCIKQLEKCNIKNYERFSAIIYNNQTSIKKGAMGCKLSHLNIIKKAKAENMPNILILEDDFLLCNNFLEKYNSIVDNMLTNKISFNMLFLGFSTHPPCEYSDTSIFNLKKITHAFTTHAYIVNNNFYDIIINAIEHSHQEVDVCYTELQKTYDNTYGIFPCLVSQSESFSDIEGYVVNYDKYIPLDNS